MFSGVNSAIHPDIEPIDLSMSLHPKCNKCSETTEPCTPLPVLPSFLSFIICLLISVQGSLVH